MQKTLTITLDAQTFEDLNKLIGKENISQYVEDLVRSHLAELELEAGYVAMAADTEREAQALEWVEALDYNLIDL